MLTKRIIPCLDVTEGRVVKGVNFVGLRDAGDPVELSDRYNLDLSFPTADALRSQRLLSYLEREGILRSGDLHRARRSTPRRYPGTGARSLRR